jgi:hypothetical protein
MTTLEQRLRLLAQVSNLMLAGSIRAYEGRTANDNADRRRAG